MNANPLPEDWTSGLFARVPRTLVSVRGADRASFLHNLCTNDVRSLQTGQGCEAFFTNVQGKVLGHAFLFCLPETILIDTTEAQGGTLLPHLEKYHIREDVVLAEWDVTTVWLAGGNAWETVKPGDVRELPVLGCATWEWGGCSITGRCVPVTSPPSYFLSCVADQADALLSNLAECGLTESTQLLEELRIQAGFPTYGVDMGAILLRKEFFRANGSADGIDLICAAAILPLTVIFAGLVAIPLLVVGLLVAGYLFFSNRLGSIDSRLPSFRRPLLLSALGFAMIGVIFGGTSADPVEIVGVFGLGGYALYLLMHADRTCQESRLIAIS